MNTLNTLRSIWIKKETADRNEVLAKKFKQAQFEAQSMGLLVPFLADLLPPEYFKLVDIDDLWNRDHNGQTLVLLVDHPRSAPIKFFITRIFDYSGGLGVQGVAKYKLDRVSVAHGLWFDLYDYEDDPVVTPVYHEWESFRDDEYLLAMGFAVNVWETEVAQAMVNLMMYCDNLELELEKEKQTTPIAEPAPPAPPEIDYNESPPVPTSQESLAAIAQLLGQLVELGCLKS